MKTKYLLILITLGNLISTLNGYTQDETSTEIHIDNNDELAEKLSNPTAAIGSLNLNIDYISYGGDLENASNQSSIGLIFQPNLPKPLKSGYNLLFRPAIPITLNQPIYNGNNFENADFGLGNISFDLALGKTSKTGFLHMFGVVSTLPTASQKELRSQWTFGPEFLIGIVKSTFIGGALITQQWDIESGPRKTSILGGQYFYAIPIGNGQNISANPIFSYNWETEDFLFPIGTGFNKVTKLGKMPFKWSAQVLYYLAKPDPFAPNWQFRLTLTPVVKLPWK